MTTFTVTRAELKKDIPDAKYGPAKVIALEFENGGSDIPLQAEWFTKAATPIPNVGDKLDGDLEPSGFGGGYSFKKASSGFQGGQRGRDPKESARIVQQHSQEMALRYAELQHARGNLPDDFNLEQVLLIAGKFAADAMGATA